MAEARSFPVPPDFDLPTFLPKLIQLYQTKGFTVTAQPFGEGAIVRFSKDDDSFKKFVGLAQAITANFSFVPGMNGQRMLMVSFTDAEWTGKIIGLAVGWIVCMIPFFIALYGAVKQSQLPNDLASDVMMLLRGGPVPPFGAAPGMGQAPYGGAPYGGNPYGGNPGGYGAPNPGGYTNPNPNPGQNPGQNPGPNPNPNPGPGQNPNPNGPQNPNGNP